MLLTIPTHAPCRVFDADGVEITRIVWANTETGEVEHLVPSREARSLGIIGDGRSPVRHTVRHKPPLTWEPIQESEVA